MLSTITSISGIKKNLSAGNYKKNRPYITAFTENLADSFNNKKLQIQNSYLKKNAELCLGMIGLMAAAVLKTVKPVQLKKLAEQVEFKEAKSIKEAEKFALDNFGIKLEADNDLFTANMINEVCTNVSNKMKGRLAFPEKIIVMEENTIAKCGKNVRGRYNVADDSIYINKQSIAGKYIIPDTKEQISLSKWLNGLSERGSGYQQIKNAWENSPGYFQRSAILKMQYCIAHELGHCNHFKLNKKGFWQSILKKEEFLKEIDKPEVKELCEQYFPSKNHTKNPLEFIADTFALKIQGRKTPLPIEKIYKNYGGISLPE